MKIGSVAWGWTPIPEDLPCGDSLIKIADQITALGFETVDYLATTEALDKFYTKEACEKLGKHSRKIGLEPNVLVFQSSAWNNPDEADREITLKYFEKCAQAAQWIGCKIISTIVPCAQGASGWRFKNSAPAEKVGFHLPAEYNYQKDWDTLTSTYKKAAIIAQKYGLRMSIECFVLSMISTPHAMLQAIQDINEPNFGIQLDTSHLVTQHIDPEWAIYILGGKNIFNMHCKDNDSVTRGNIPAGSGIVDYTAVISALKSVGYEGNLMVELEFTDNPRRYNKQALEHLQQCVSGEY